MNSDDKNLPKTVSVQLGENVSDFYQRNGLSDTAQSIVGLNFDEVHWDYDNKAIHTGTVKILHGEYGFSVGGVLGVTAVSDDERSDEGIIKVNFSSALTPSETIPHDEARRRIEGLARKFYDLGWKRVVWKSKPRLSGKEATRYVLAGDLAGHSVYPLDSTYTHTPEEWMKLDSPRWLFYADGVYLELSFFRDFKRMADYYEQEGAYLVTIKLESLSTYLRSSYGKNWKETWEEGLKKKTERELVRRAKAELKLKAQGYTIDESYQDIDTVPDIEKLLNK